MCLDFVEVCLDYVDFVKECLDYVKTYLDYVKTCPDYVKTCPDFVETCLDKVLDLVVTYLGIVETCIVFKLRSDLSRHEWLKVDINIKLTNKVKLCISKPNDCLLAYSLTYRNNAQFSFQFRASNRIGWRFQCLVISWYISADIQLAVVGGILLFTFAKNRKAGIIASVIALIGFITVTFMVAYWNQFHGILRLYMRWVTFWSILYSPSPASFIIAFEWCKFDISAYWRNRETRQNLPISTWQLIPELDRIWSVSLVRLLPESW